MPIQHTHSPTEIWILADCVQFSSLLAAHPTIEDQSLPFRLPLELPSPIPMREDLSYFLGQPGQIGVGPVRKGKPYLAASADSVELSRPGQRPVVDKGHVAQRRDAGPGFYEDKEAPTRHFADCALK